MILDHQMVEEQTEQLASWVYHHWHKDILCYDSKTVKGKIHSYNVMCINIYITWIVNEWFIDVL